MASILSPGKRTNLFHLHSLNYKNQAFFYSRLLVHFLICNLLWFNSPKGQCFRCCSVVFGTGYLVFNCSKLQNHSCLPLVSSGHLTAFTMYVEWSSSSCLACLKVKKSVWTNSALFGILFQTPRRQKRLFCRYHDGNRNPHLLIAPFKEEDEWDSPHIVRYYDVMSDEEIEKIKQLAKPRVSFSFPILLMTANSMLQSLLARTRQRVWKIWFCTTDDTLQLWSLKISKLLGDIGP